MTIDIQVLLTFYIFMLLCVASNKEMRVKEFKAQFMMVGLSVIGWCLFKMVELFSGFI
jgi:hypothetical protein